MPGALLLKSFLLHLLDTLPWPAGREREKSMAGGSQRFQCDSVAGALHEAPGMLRDRVAAAGRGKPLPYGWTAATEINDKYAIILNNIP